MLAPSLDADEGSSEDLDESAAHGGAQGPFASKAESMRYQMHNMEIGEFHELDCMTTERTKNIGEDAMEPGETQCPNIQRTASGEQ